MGNMIVGFLTDQIWLLPNWAWFVIFVGIACLLIAVIILTCVIVPLIVRSAKKKKQAQAEDKGDESEEKKEEAQEKVEDKKEVKEEQKAEEKEVEKKAPEKKAEAKSSTKATTTKSTATKAAAAKKEEETANETKVYHISKRKEDGKWQVKAEGADRALRLFFTQADAIAYAKKVAGNQEGRIVVHKEGGGFRKLNY